MTSAARGYFFLAAAALQFGMQPILTRTFIPAGASKATLVLLCEFAKIVLSMSFLFFETPEAGRRALESWDLKTSLRVAGPAAAIYAVQNVVIQIGYQNLDSLTFNLLNQWKILSTAVMLYFVMGRRQSLRQCVALMFLLAAGTLLCLAEASAEEGRSVDGLRKNSFAWGVVPALLSGMMSGAATSFAQKAMQGQAKRNAYLYTTELAVLGSSLLATGLVARGEPLVELRGLTPLSALPILTNAMGGIIIGQLVKHLGGVVKSYSVILGILVTSAAQCALTLSLPSAELFIAVPMTVGSLYVYTQNPYKGPAEAGESKAGKSKAGKSKAE
jgi:UDP-sugar transporter A1/2/3